MDIDTFKAIESHIEDEGLLKLMIESSSEDVLDEEDALEFYAKLKKAA